MKTQKKSKDQIDTEKREAALSELLLLMKDYSPIVKKIRTQFIKQGSNPNQIPDAVTEYHLNKAGFQTSDVAITRLISLATQKFVSDIATDAIQYAKLRQQQTQSKEKKLVFKDKRTVLTVDDLAGAMAEHGANMKKPEYYI